MKGIQERSRALQHYHDHKEERAAQKKIYKRQHVLRYKRNGKSFDISGVNKRPYPADIKCECCRYTWPNIRLTYHHNDDANILKGVWVCFHCHMMIEKIIKNPHMLKVFNKYTKMNRILGFQRV